MFKLFEIMAINSVAESIDKMGAEMKAFRENIKKEIREDERKEEVRRAKASFSSKEDGFRANFEPWTEDDRFAMFRNED